MRTPTHSSRKNGSTAAPRLAAGTRQFAVDRAPGATNTSPEQVRARAYEIYLVRTGTGGGGDEISDWMKAEYELNSAPAEPTVPNDVEIKARARGETLMAGAE